MKRACILLTAGLTAHAISLAQTQPRPATAFQSADTLSAAGGRGGGRGAAGPAIPLPRAEAGKPFSATATSQATQTLPDGTHLTQTNTILQYRDAEGRVRTERIDTPVKQHITIRDFVAGAVYDLDPVKKIAVRIPLNPGSFGALTPTMAARGGGGGAGGVGIAAGGGRGRGANADTMTRPAGVSAATEALAATYQGLVQARGNPNVVEELGTMNVNGVPATGTRTTTVIPLGAIGNDKELRTVSERWFSPDLNLLVKSITNDPRFGTTTYELTNISRTPPDPSLFRLPADYTIAQM